MMQLPDRINTLSSLVRESSAEGRQTRRRLGAGVSLTILMSGLLTAIGLGIIVVAFAGTVLVAISGAAAARAVPAYWARARAPGGKIAGAVLRRSVIALAVARSGLRHLRGVASSALGWLRLRGPGLAKVCADRAARARRQLATSGEATVTRMREGHERMQRQRRSQGTRPLDLHREALRLNASGTRHRRNGAHAEAVDLHRRALEILHRLDDRRAVALTQNNLALALSHVGDDSSAIALFEEAAAAMRELGEDEHEGRIIANLGLAHRRQGRHDESANVLQLALTKLTPASSAYETVEAEVRKAS
jgi:tetratricopeptide (TPR) repeat protein